MKPADQRRVRRPGPQQASPDTGGRRARKVADKAVLLGDGWDQVVRAEEHVGPASWVRK